MTTLKAARRTYRFAVIRLSQVSMKRPATRAAATAAADSEMRRVAALP
jgi:hypothetical protein